MNKIAYIYSDYVINWSAIILVMAIAAAIIVGLALSMKRPGYTLAYAVTIPLGMVLGGLIGRIIHWYCRTNQYDSFAQAFTDFSVGGFALIGVIIGCLMAAFIVWCVGLAPNFGKLLDIFAPTAAIAIALGRLSFLFNDSARGKVLIEKEANRHYPIGSAVINSSSGATEWRFATFFVQSIVAAIIFIIVLAAFFYITKLMLKNGGSAAGNVFFLFLILFFSTEILLDSTRYDALFMRSNGFVSLMQIFSAVMIVTPFVWLTARSVNMNGRKLYQLVAWVVYLGALGLAGYMEYYVQRHGNLYMLSYTLMALGLVLSMACAVFMMVTTLKRKN